jgi:hypothetical protein
VRNLERVLAILSVFTKLATLFAASVATLGLSGCLVAGYSSGGGWFVWPGSLGLLVIVLIVVFLMRRR